MTIYSFAFSGPSGKDHSLYGVYGEVGGWQAILRYPCLHRHWIVLGVTLDLVQDLGYLIYELQKLGRNVRFDSRRFVGVRYITLG